MSSFINGRSTNQEIGIIMTEIFFLIEDAIEGGYTAKAVGQSIFTAADSMDELKKNIKEAVKCHFEDRDKKS